MPDVPQDVLSRTKAGLAVCESSELRWCNLAFQQIADLLGVPEQVLADRALEGGKPIVVADGASFDVVVDRGESNDLVQLFPWPGGQQQGGHSRLDDATGVLSRPALRGEYEAWFARRDERPFALVFLDLDRFKSVNDRHGHLVGDECLRIVGGRLRRLIRSGDLVGRYGGDEFLFLLAGVEGPETFRPIADRLRARLNQPVETRSGDVLVGASFGVAFSGGPYSDVDEMLAAADRDMYRSKGIAIADVADSARFG